MVLLECFCVVVITRFLGGEMKFLLEIKIYPVEAIMQAAYNFIDRIYVFLSLSSDGKKVVVSIKEKKKISRANLGKIKSEFLNELLHSTLRCKISKQTKKIREYIVGRALYSPLGVGDFASFDEDLPFEEDPLGIAIPWEEKYGKKESV